MLLSVHCSWSIDSVTYNLPLLNDVYCSRYLDILIGMGAQSRLSRHQNDLNRQSSLSTEPSPGCDSTNEAGDDGADDQSVGGDDDFNDGYEAFTGDWSMLLDDLGDAQNATQQIATAERFSEVAGATGTAVGVGISVQDVNEAVAVLRVQEQQQLAPARRLRLTVNEREAEQYVLGDDHWEYSKV